MRWGPSRRTQRADRSRVNPREIAFLAGIASPRSMMCSRISSIVHPAEAGRNPAIWPDDGAKNPLPAPPQAGVPKGEDGGFVAARQNEYSSANWISLEKVRRQLGLRRANSSESGRGPRERVLPRNGPRFRSTSRQASSFARMSVLSVRRGAKLARSWVT